MTHSAKKVEEIICGCAAWAWTPVGFHEELSRTSSEMETVEYHACGRCGAICKLPQPDKKVLRAYYESAWQYSSERPGLERAAAFIARGIRQPDGAGRFPLKAGPGLGESSFVGNGKVLEVAAKGDGMFRALEDQRIRFLGTSMLDVQPQADGIEPVWLGDGKSHLIPEQKNALVVAAHVLEHVLDPYQFLVDVFRLCAPLGFVYLEVPSLYGGRFDIGLCDDANRNHLWHYGLAGLSALCSRLGTPILLETDLGHPGWPVDRILVQKWAIHDASRNWLGEAMIDVKCEYEKAEMALYGRSPTTTALYGASHSYAQIRALWKNEGRRYAVYDRYKAGQNFDGVTVRHPDQLVLDGIQRVFVTTRSYNSYVDIKRDLYARFPWLSVHTLYPNIREACREEAPPPAAVVP